MRRRDADEKHAVETRIPRVDRELIRLALLANSGFGSSNRYHE
jgi:hypothetical protein